MFDTTVLHLFKAATAVGAPVPALPVPFGAIQVIDGRMDHNGDRDVFRLEVLPGHRYLIGLAMQAPGSGDLADPSGGGGSSGSARGFGLSLAYADCPDSWMLSVGRNSYGDDLVDFTVLEPDGDSVVLSVATDPSGLFMPSGYRLAVVEITADDHGTWDDPTPLPVGGRRYGVLDLPGDLDAFAITLRAGERVKFTLEPLHLGLHSRVHANLYQATTGGLYRVGAGTVTDPSTQQAAQEWVFSPELDGTYILTISGHHSSQPALVTAMARYAISVSSFESDGNDLRSDAQTIPLDQTVTVDLDLLGDVDWLRFESVPGQRYHVSANVVDENSTHTVHFGVPDSSALHWSHTSAGGYGGAGYSSGFDWWSMDGGPVDVFVERTGSNWSFGQESIEGSLEVELVIRPWDEPAWPDMPSDPLIVYPGKEVSGLGSWTPNAAGTLVKAYLEAGERYALQVSGFAYMAHVSRVYDPEAVYDRIDWLGASRQFRTSGDGSWYGGGPDSQLLASVTATVSGWHDVWVAVIPGFPFTVAVHPVARDDHGDIAAQATRLSLNTGVEADISWFDDDLFRVDLQAGHRYRIDVDSPDGALETLRIHAEHLSYWGERWMADGDLSVIFVPQADGPYWLLPEGRGRIELLIEEVGGADDHGDIASQATVIDLVGLPSPAAEPTVPDSYGP